MVTIQELTRYAREHGCSDIHLTSNLPPVFRKNGELAPAPFEVTRSELRRLILSLLPPDCLEAIANADIKTPGDFDFAFTTPDGRQRANVYWQQGYLSAAIRILSKNISSFEELNLPPVLQKLANEPQGLVLVTGPTGCGKSTTLAAMIDYINRTKRLHILTLEDPVEYVHTHKRSMVHQREVGADTASFCAALRSALREDPDIILVGEMRDSETITAAVTAAETGHLVLSTLHTTGAANTIDRIINAFAPHNRQQVRKQLASVLRGVITQQLVPTLDGSCTAAFEIMLGSDAVLSLIREDKCHQLNSAIRTGSHDGMCLLDSSLAALVNTGKAALEKALEKAVNPAEFYQFIRR